MTVRRAPHPDDRGVVLVIVALFVTVIAVMAAFVVDHGFARQETRHAQGTSDAAALAAAQELPLVAPDPAAAAAAAQQAADNAASNVSGSLVTSVEVPCGDGAGSGARCYDAGEVSVVVETPYVLSSSVHPPHNLVRVQVCQPSETFFGGVVGATSREVCRSAVARRVNATGGYGFGLVALDPVACPGMTFSGNSDTALSSNGAVVVNSECDSALSANGKSWELTAAFIGVVGGAELAPCDPVTSTKCTNTVPREGIPSFDDPLGETPIPDRPLPPGRDCDGIVQDGVRVLEPGLYQGCRPGPGVHVLRPGLYYVEDGFRLNSNTELICANSGTPTTPGNPCDGVTFYVASGAFQFNGGGTLDIPPPADGPWAGISVFQAPGNTADSRVNGASYSDIGTIYAPDAKVDFLGNGDINVYGIVVADRVELNGSFTFDIDVPLDGPEVQTEDDIGLED